MNATHLTVYVDPHLGFIIDEDLPDNVDGTRNPGTSGVRFTSAKSAGEYVAHWISRMAKGQHLSHGLTVRGVATYCQRQRFPTADKAGVGLPLKDATIAEAGRKIREKNALLELARERQ